MPASAGDARDRAAASLRARFARAVRHLQRRPKGRALPRPTAKRLCELVLVRSGRRVDKEVAFEAIFSRQALVKKGELEHARDTLATALELAQQLRYA